MRNRDPLSRASDQFLSAMALLTRLPLPDHRPHGAEAAWAWPLVGALLGLIGAAAGCLLLALGSDPGPAAAITLAMLALLTGGLHEDGLSDTADGLMGGRDKARRLEIMKDSRIGSFGALALILVTLISWSSLTSALDDGNWAALPAAAALSRAAMAGLMAALPPARSSGLSASSGRPSVATAGLAGLAALFVALIACGWAAIPAALGCAAVTALLGRAARRLIGGQTGDILGTAQMLTFASALTICA